MPLSIILVKHMIRIEEISTVLIYHSVRIEKILAVSIYHLPPLCVGDTRRSEATKSTFLKVIENLSIALCAKVIAFF